MTGIPTPTRGLSEVVDRIPSPTPSLDELYEGSAHIVNRVTALVGDASDLEGDAVSVHVRAVQLKLAKAATTLTQTRSIKDLLEMLAGSGFSWRQISALAGVSVPAVRKWRTGGAATGPHSLRIASLVALLQWLANDKVVTDPASWLAMPLHEDAPVTRLDFLKARRDDLVIEELTGSTSRPEVLLQEFDPTWRTRYQSDYEVFVADDGQRSIRSKRA